MGLDSFGRESPTDEEIDQIDSDLLNRLLKGGLLPPKMRRCDPDLYDLQVQVAMVAQCYVAYRLKKPRYNAPRWSRQEAIKRAVDRLDDEETDSEPGKDSDTDTDIEENETDESDERDRRRKVYDKIQRLYENRLVDDEEVMEQFTHHLETTYDQYRIAMERA